MVMIMVLLLLLMFGVIVDAAADYDAGGDGAPATDDGDVD